MKDAEVILKCKDVKPTPNRILVLNALLDAAHPVSMGDLESAIETMDRSSIFRTLTLFVQHDIVRSIEDGSGSLKYEVCGGEQHCTIADMHPHFYCESCHETSCFEDIHIPEVALPSGYHVHSVNYMVKGLCPKCVRKVSHN